MTTDTTQEAAAWARQQALKALAGAKAAMGMAGTPLPPVVCLCGSTRFYEAFAAANLRLTLAGEIVLSIGCDTKSDGDLAATGEIDLNAVKARLDELHKRKIDLADRVLVVSDESGYFGESTAGEITYAVKLRKPVEFEHQAAAQRALDAGLLDGAAWTVTKRGEVAVVTAGTTNPDPMWEQAYMDVQAVLDKALGVEAVDGAGAGIAADVALLASQRDEARAELARTRRAAETLGKTVVAMARSMEAARIEMLQNGPEKAMQWILNSLPDVDDNAPEDQWDGTESAEAWFDRTQEAAR